ncbi:MAG: hypothetical protein LBK62_13155 [Treponema sp.]|jgi:hypothetical protein|nr:hypothetical protein [Treponema sp.]
MFILIPLGLILLSSVIYMALSKKSSPKIRIAALIALATMVLSLVISLFLILVMGPVEPEAPLIPFAMPIGEPPDTETNILVLLGFALFLLALFTVVLVISLREQRRSRVK